MGNSRSERFQEHVEALSDEDRRQVLARTTGQIYLAAQGVCQQADRLRASHSVTHTEHQSDGIFFVFSLHRLISLLDLAVRLADEEHRPTVTDAVRRLRGVAGDNQRARDVLSHLDEYIAGFGRDQPEAGAQPLPWFSRTGSEYTVRVGDYAIDVDAAEAAALEAFNAALSFDH